MDIIDDVKVKEDGTLTFKSDKFSTYVLTYKDSEIVTEKETNPNTADGIITYISILLIGTIGIMITTNSLKRKYNR